MKMHVRDEQLESGGKGRLKRRFEARAKGKERPVDAQMPGPLFSGMWRFISSQLNYSNDCLAAQTIDAGPPRTFTIPVQPPTLPKFDSTSTGGDSQSQNGNPTPGREFQDIINHHRQLVADDEDGQDRVHSPSTAIPKTPLADLFDFASDEWAKKYNRYTRIGYDEELELYDLLEMDVEGEIDDLDDFTQDILMN